MLKKVIIIIIIAVVGLFIILLLRGPEDTWLCTDDGWVKHGNPYAPMPEYGCNGEKPSQESVAWEAIKSVINNCEVKSVMQTHALEVSVDLKDGRILNAVEPQIDDIIDLAVESEEKCGTIIIFTE